LTVPKLQALHVTILAQLQMVVIAQLQVVVAVTVLAQLQVVVTVTILAQLQVHGGDCSTSGGSGCNSTCSTSGGGDCNNTCSSSDIIGSVLVIGDIGNGNSSTSFATESGAGTIMQSPGRGLFLPDFFPFWTLYSVLVELDLL
jgi:Fe-S cluster biogenesis protein NfuA